MMAAILCNLPTLYASGSFHGYAPGHGTSWNPNWATDYGPDKEATEAEVQEAIEVVKALPAGAPEYFEDAQTVVAATPLAAELMKSRDDLVAVMRAQYAYRRWRRDEDDTAILLLM